MSVIHSVDIIDKNGKRNTVRKRVEAAPVDKVRSIGMRGAVEDSQSFEHPSFPEAEDKATVKAIKQVFKGAVEFRFDFEVDGSGLYIMNRSVIMDGGETFSDEGGSDDDLERLDAVSARLADVYYLLGAFGSHKRVRVVNQDSTNRYVAIRLD